MPHRVHIEVAFDSFHYNFYILIWGGEAMSVRTVIDKRTCVFFSTALLDLARGIFKKFVPSLQTASFLVPLEDSHGLE